MATKKILINVQVSSGASPQQINAVKKALDGVAHAQTKVTQATKQGRAQSGLNNAILLESGRLASDLNYGFTAIANNLGQLVTLFGSFVETNKGVVDSFKQLAKSLWGMGGILIGVQLLIAFGPKLWEMLTGVTQRMKDLADITKQASKEAGEQIGKLEALVEILDSTTESTVEKKQAVDELNRSHKNLNLKLDDEGRLTKESKKAIEDYIPVLIERAKASALMTKIQSKYVEMLDAEMSSTQDNVAWYEALFITIKNGASNLLSANVLTSETVLEIMKKGKKNRKELIKDIHSDIDFLFNEYKKLSTTGFSADALVTVNQLKSARDIITDPKKIAEGKTALQLWAEETLGIMADTNLKELEIIDHQNKEKKKRAERAFKQRIKIARLEAEGKLHLLDMYGQGLNFASELAGKNTGVGKALAIASTTISTYSAAQRAYESQFLPVPTPSSPLRAEIARGVAILSGLAQVKSILAVKTPAMKEASGVSGAAAGAGTAQAPDFNVVGAGGVSQLATTLAGVTGQPLKAFVVSKEITSAQELERNITTTAAIG